MNYLPFLVLLGVGFVPFASGAQLEAEILYGEDKFEPEFSFLRVVVIEYPQGSDVADLLQDTRESISFEVDSDAVEVEGIVAQLNEHLQSVGSNATVTDIAIKYHAGLQGNESHANIEYKIQMIPTITGHFVSDGLAKNTVDASWRGIALSGPLFVETEYGMFDINNPLSALDVLSPKVSGSFDSSDVLGIPLVDASRILEFPLHKWHSLFDNTAIIASAAEYNFAGKHVLTHYSMGECNLETGLCNDRKWEETVLLDAPYLLRVVESRDDASIVLEGYAESTYIDGTEVIRTSLESPLSQKPDTDEFPAMVMYGMAGAAAIGGAAVFVFSNQKLKRDQDQEQTGIDPSRLISYETSTSAGGYKTNRGESYLLVGTNSKTAI